MFMKTAGQKIRRSSSLVVMAMCAAVAGAQTTYSFTTFTVPGSTETGPLAISESGEVTGFYSMQPSGASGGFLRSTAGTITMLSYPGATGTAAFGMNKFGVIAGDHGSGSTNGGFLYHNGFYKNIVVNGQPAPLTDINDHGYYVGGYGSAAPLTGFVASPSGQITVLQYPGGYYTFPYWVKDGGEVIGTYQDQFQNLHTFLWNAKAGYRTLTVPGLPKAQITDINSSGTIVGGYFDGVSNRGFVYQNGKVQIVEPPGANDSSIAAINNKGQVAGAYTTPGSMYMGFIATPVQ
jgi:uncharacterized membrane protein